MLDQTALPAEPDRPERGAVPARREGAGVAVCERAGARPEQRHRVLGHAPAAFDLICVELACALGGRIVAHPVERPREVDGGRPRRSQDAIGLVEVVPELGGERVAVRGSHADGRRAANGERPYRLRHLVGAPALERDLFVRQPPLVEEDHGAVLQADDVVRRQHAQRSYPR